MFLQDSDVAASMKSDYLHKTWHRNLLEQKLCQHHHYLRQHILDIGSKNRRYDHLFMGTITAVDIVPNKRLNVSQADLEQKLPFPDAAFDSVLCLEVFEYLENYQKAIAEIYRVMRPGSHAIISIPFLYHAHFDKLRFTEEFITTQLQCFSKIQCYKIGNGYTVIWDITRKKVMSLSNQPLRLALLFTISPYLIMAKLLKLDQRTDQFYSGLFLIARK